MIAKRISITLSNGKSFTFTGAATITTSGVPIRKAAR